MTRISPLLLYVGLWGGTTFSLPNILIITVENLGWADVSWHNPEVIMPNIATLASSGVILGTEPGHLTSEYLVK